MLLFSLLLIATIPHTSSASDQNTQVCNSRFATCTSNDEQRRPVCGSDNLTYHSRCHLLRAQCQGMPVTVQHRGRCKGKAKTGRRSPLRGRKQKKGCGREDRSTFNRNLIKIFKTEYNRISSVLAGEESPESSQKNSDRLVLDWKFSTMDKDTDEFLVKSEYKDLRRLVKKVVKPKRCAKTFTKLCDLDHDERISKDEWVACLGLDFNLMQGSISTLSDEDEDSSVETRDEPEVTDCHSDRKAVLEEMITSNSELYVPDCTPDGRYQTIQCYKSTGYCWCVQEDSGKPIPGTSVKDQVPKCDSIPAPARPMNGCPEPYKQTFIIELMNLMKRKMAASTNATETGSSSVAVKESRQLSPEVQVATWNFLMLDKNKNKVLEKKEWKNFRALVSSKPQLHRCGKRLPRYCDVNHDRKISITEWLNCVNAQRNSTFSVNPTAGSRRRGLNPLQIYLKGED